MKVRTTGSRRPIRTARGPYRANQSVAPPAQRGLPAVPPHRPRDVAADHVARYPGGYDADEVQAGPRDRAGGERAPEGHDQLGGDRQARRLCHHEHENGDVPVGGYEVLHGSLSSCWGIAWRAGRRIRIRTAPTDAAGTPEPWS